MYASTTLRNAYRPKTSIDSLDDGGDLVKGEWRKNKKSFFLLKVLKTGYIPTVSAKSTRENFKGIINEKGAVLWRGQC